MNALRKFIIKSLLTLFFNDLSFKCSIIITNESVPLSLLIVLVQQSAFSVGGGYALQSDQAHSFGRDKQHWGRKERHT